MNTTETKYHGEQMERLYTLKHNSEHKKNIIRDELNIIKTSIKYYNNAYLNTAKLLQSDYKLIKNLLIKTDKLISYHQTLFNNKLNELEEVNKQIIFTNDMIKYHSKKFDEEEERREKIILHEGKHDRKNTKKGIYKWSLRSALYNLEFSALEKVEFLIMHVEDSNKIKKDLKAKIINEINDADIVNICKIKFLKHKDDINNNGDKIVKKYFNIEVEKILYKYGFYYNDSSSHDPIKYNAQTDSNPSETNNTDDLYTDNDSESDEEQELEQDREPEEEEEEEEEKKEDEDGREIIQEPANTFHDIGDDYKEHTPETDNARKLWLNAIKLRNLTREEYKNMKNFIQMLQREPDYLGDKEQRIAHYMNVLFEIKLKEERFIKYIAEAFDTYETALRKVNIISISGLNNVKSKFKVYEYDSTGMHEIN
jgi:hypothetical protein